MGYRALINSNINKAFNLLKDLAIDATLTKKSSVSFSFSTGDSTIVESPTIATKIVSTDTKKNGETTNTITKIIMLKTSEIGDLSSYDKISFESYEWKFGPIITTDTFITVSEVFREV